MKVDKEKVKKVETFVQQNFKLRELFSQLNMKHKDGKIFCPFHSETNPSFSVNFEENIFHCFSCNSGGGYLRFLYLYKNFAEPGIDIRTSQKGIGKNYYEFLQEFIRDNPRIQEFAMINSIQAKKNYSVTLSDLEVIEIDRHKPNRIEVQSMFIQEKNITDISALLDFYGNLEKNTAVVDSTEEFDNAATSEMTNIFLSMIEDGDDDED